MSLNDNENEYYLDGVYKKQVQLLDYNKCQPDSLIKNIAGKNPSVNYILQRIEYGDDEKIKYLHEARLHGRKPVDCPIWNYDYDNWKLKSRHIIWGSISNGISFEEITIDSFTGLVYGEFDKNELNDAGLTVEVLKEKIIKYPFIVAVWQSFGGNGIGLLASVQGIKTVWDYKSTYIQLSELFVKDIGLAMDKRCKSPVRKNALAYDPELLLNEYPTEFIFEVRPEPPPTRNPSDDLDYDPELHADDNLINNYLEEFQSYYLSLTFADKQTMQPVKYSGDVKFNPNEHFLIRYFPKSVIKTQELKNEENTLANFGNGVAAVRIQIYENLKIYHYYRYITIKAILSNYFYLEDLNNPGCVDKNNIYNAAIALNARCYDENGINPDTLPETELNDMACSIFDKLANGELELSVSCKKNILNYEFYNKFSKEQLKHKPILIINAARELTGNSFTCNLFVKAQELYDRIYSERGISMTKKEIAYHLSVFLKISWKTVQNRLCSWKCRIQNPDTGISTCGKEIKVTSTGISVACTTPSKNEKRVNEAIESIINKNERVTNTAISDITGLHRTTVIRIRKKLADDTQLTCPDPIDYDNQKTHGNLNCETEIIELNEDDHTGNLAENENFLSMMHYSKSGAYNLTNS